MNSRSISAGRKNTGQISSFILRSSSVEHKRPMLGKKILWEENRARIDKLPSNLHHQNADFRTVSLRSFYHANSIHNIESHKKYNDTLKLLVETGANVRIALLEAIKYKNYDMITFLAPQTTDFILDTALSNAQYNKDTRAIDILMAHKACKLTN